MTAYKRSFSCLSARSFCRVDDANSGYPIWVGYTLVWSVEPMLERRVSNSYRIQADQLNCFEVRSCFPWDAFIQGFLGCVPQFFYSPENLDAPTSVEARKFIILSRKSFQSRADLSIKWLAEYLLIKLHNLLYLLKIIFLCLSTLGYCSTSSSLLMK